MNLTNLAYALMAAGSVSALVFSAGPLGSSLTIQILFVLSVLCLLGGAILRRVAGHRTALSDHANGNFDQAGFSLESLDRELEQLISLTPQPNEMVRFHDTVLQKTNPFMREFVQYRQSILDGLGIGPYSELMIGFARVERSINRCLSAAADGDRAEARRSLTMAHRRMKTCLGTWHRYYEQAESNSISWTQYR